MLTIDCTTKSDVYNPLAAQGTWYQHIWGRRQYPSIDLDLDWYLDRFLYDNSGVSLSSIYGDPLCWPSLIHFMEEKKHDSRCCMDIQTFASSPIIFDVARYKCNFSICIDGLDDLCGKVFAGANWEIFKTAISDLGPRVAIIFHAFHHNRHQIPQVIEMAEKHNAMVQLIPGCLRNNPGTSVVSENYQWLYDVIPENIHTDCVDAKELSDIKKKYSRCVPIDLEKTLWGYTSLRTYLPIVKNRSINDNPLVTPKKLSRNIERKAKEKFSSKNWTVITPDCKIFKNHSLYSTYMHMLGTDWSASASDVTETADHSGSPIHDVVYCAQYFKENSKVIQQTP